MTEKEVQDRIKVALAHQEMELFTAHRKALIDARIEELDRIKTGDVVRQIEGRINQLEKERG